MVGKMNLIHFVQSLTALAAAMMALAVVAASPVTMPSAGILTSNELGTYHDVPAQKRGEWVRPELE